MTISKEAVEAAEGVWSIGNRFGPDADRKHDIAEYLESLFLALRSAPSQSTTLATAHAVGHKMGLLAGTDIGPIREALDDATLAGAAAEREALCAYVEQLGHPGCKFIAEAIRGK